MDNELSELELLFRIVFRKMREQYSSVMSEYVTINEFIVLKHLLKGKMRVSDLSRALQVSASHITSITDSLVQKQLIERERSSKDRRVVVLCLTNEGNDLIKKLNTLNSEFLQEKFKVFSKEEINDLICLLRKLENSII
ncbi:MarR family winged helix-turn-helix transcriptional regulator [Heyndrickxia sp. NPDC080065]|uniref:MarR family winged helix-turn-helix transcriptional regulator n=1 Tax=Heyndrickxia sp. NPDC080065 TaxID=3390568 RepID=UPI003CFD6463